MNEAIGLVLRGDSPEGVFAMPEGITVRKRSLSIRKGTPWDSIERAIHLTCDLCNFAVEDLPWLLGDLLNEAEREHGEDRVEQAVRLTGWTYETVKNYRWAAKRVPAENRHLGKEALPIRFGMNVAPLPPDEQRRVLQQAGREGLTATECHRLAKGNPDYKRKAVPEKGATKRERVLAAFPRVFAANERRMRAETLQDAARFLWELCVDMCLETARSEK